MITRRLLAAAFAGAIATTMLACSTGATSGNPTSPGTNSGSPPGNAQMTATVTIKNFKYVPDNVTIKKGGTVIWKNEDADKHDATPSNNTGFAPTKLLAQNESSAPVTFDTVGAFDYFCSVHPPMKGKVTVVE